MRNALSTRPPKKYNPAIWLLFYVEFSMDPDVVQVWLPEEAAYLETLKRECNDLHCRYDAEYYRMRTLQMRFRIPAICFGAINGVASFGTGTFPPPFQQWVSVVVGVIAIAIAIAQTIETFLRISETMGGSIAVSSAFKKLASDIGFELTLPLRDRAMSGIIFTRDAYTRYQQIMSQRPPMDVYATVATVATAPSIPPIALLTTITTNQEGGIVEPPGVGPT